MNVTEQVRSWIYLTIAESTCVKLSGEDRAAVMAAAVHAVLAGKGMVFVEVDGAAFQVKVKNAVLANVNDEIEPIVEGLFSE
ncbi:MAG: hypothetical protein ACP5EN_03655 [Rhodovulum sp.]